MMMIWSCTFGIAPLHEKLCLEQLTGFRGHLWEECMVQYMWLHVVTDADVDFIRKVLSSRRPQFPRSLEKVNCT